MAWDLAPSLKTLRTQVNKAFPNRSKKSDGTIGDTAHASRASDHNPNSEGIVCAFDITHDPANGADCHVMFEAIRKNPHPNCKYIIFDGKIASRKLWWIKRPKSGHTQHMHVSVGVGNDGKSKPGTYNDTSLWDIGSKPEPPKPPKIVDLGDDMQTAVVTVTIGTKDDKGKGWGAVNTGKTVKACWAVLNSSNPKERYPGFEGITVSSTTDGKQAIGVVEGAKPGSKFDIRIFWVN